MKPAFGLFLVLLSCVASFSQSTTTRQTRSIGKVGAQKSNSLPAETIPHAEWTEGVESIVGLTREQFSEAGLVRLTRDEYKELLLAVYNNRENAVKNAVAAQMKYQCGPIPQTYDRVKVYVEISTATTSEVATGIRQGLASLRDVQIVYTEIEADVGFELVGAAYTTEAGHQLGYNVSVIAFDPCKGSIGDREWPFRVVNDHVILGGPEAPELVNRIVSEVDTDVLEKVRKQHAAIKKVTTKAP